MSRIGRVEKSVDAHRGAVLVGKWSHDATGLLTGTFLFTEIMTILGNLCINYIDK